MAVSKPTLGADTYPLSCILEEEEEEEREEGEDTCKNVLLSLTEFLEVEGRGQRYKASGGSANGSCWSLGEVLGENKGEWETAVEGLRAAHEALNWGLYQATSVKAGVTRDTRLRWKPTSKQLRAIYGAGSVDDWTTYEQVKYSEEQHNELVTATRIRQTDVGDEDKQIGKVRLRGGGCGFKKFIWRSSSSQPSTPIRLNIRNLPISSPILQDPNTLGILPSNMTARKTQYTHQRRDPNAPALPAMRPFRDLSSGVDSLTDPLFEQSSVASFYQEPHMYTTQSRFLGEQDQRISQIDWPPPPKTVPGDRNEPLPRKPLSMSSVHSDHSVSFLRSALESSEQGALRGHNSYGRQQNKKFLGPPSFPLANESAPTRQGKSEGEEPLPGLASPSNLSLERPSGRSLRRGHRGPDLGVSNGHDQEVHSNDRPDVPMKGYHANGSADADGARRSIWDGGGCQSVTPDDAISAILTKKHHGQRAIPSLEERSDSEPGEYNIANRSQRRIIRQRFHQEAAELYDSHQARLRGIDGDANKSEAEKVRATTEENETFKLLMDQAAKNTSFQVSALVAWFAQGLRLMQT